ncbi:hypothetical protein AXI71_gp28 [Lactococcus phage GE1]|uniref:Uncharacterized protein n=1 Tax=Lactococcus phage GE1 TaxID=1698369 RepID=A0A0N9BAT6_9CAUD|nr:hypothetical protein AXI71_gp28 [Lactococcus phage GE1]ALA06982.1 hypothetical protein [Lactococcus phage GE1]
MKSVYFTKNSIEHEMTVAYLNELHDDILDIEYGLETSAYFTKITVYSLPI